LRSLGAAARLRNARPDLSNGDFLVTGPREVDATNPWKDRHQRFEMWVLDRSLTKPPVALGEFIDEGPAVSRSRTRPRIA
jgi:hypothetical protein